MSNVAEAQIRVEQEVFISENEKSELSKIRNKKKKSIKLIVYPVFGFLFLISLITLSFLNNSLFMTEILISSFIISCLIIIKMNNDIKSPDYFSK
ncbi:hypothetical protein [Aquimarina sp. MMG016]|uniref:hypothetical protein n=1 Tax=Aquimarina sp. MMG016 TaxID=2822690 RepID=UPI001B39F956|nr:hypothetical protein [Aquimarina sp. MMG016]MBQ4821363.1 hypothetical protein [Aquimarina sp. MMG016]